MKKTLHIFVEIILETDGLINPVDKLVSALNNERTSYITDNGFVKAIKFEEIDETEIDLIHPYPDMNDLD
jgi:hypothetical protein